jgi:hypothetical protein
MAREITTTGSKKIKTLMKEFNENFPYLRLRIYSYQANEHERGRSLTKYRVDIEKKLSEVRTKKGSGKMSFTGSKNISTIEKDFDEIFGLVVEICYSPTPDENYYTHGSHNKKSLTAFNRECERAGYVKNKWK